MSSFPLPLRPAVPSQQQQQDQDQQPQTDLSSSAAVGSDPLPSIDEEGPAPASSPRTAGVDSIIAQVAKWVDTTSGLQPKQNHQFWVNDSNIAENLFTVSLLSTHLLSCPILTPATPKTTQATLVLLTLEPDPPQHKTPAGLYQLHDRQS